MAACGGCSARQASSRRPPTPVSAFRVVDLEGRCLLETPEGLCRVFASTAAAVAVARAEIGSSGWTTEPVLV